MADKNEIQQSQSHMGKPLVFLSHSSQNKELAASLENQIKSEIPHVEVFRSSRPDAIPSGEDWFNTILENLDNASAIVILMTPPAENSFWVAFETGYFWKAKGRKGIFPLYHPNVRIPEPLGRLEAKQIVDCEEMRNFFRSLCACFRHEYRERADVTEIVEQAQNLKARPPERSPERFIELLETGTWEELKQVGPTTYMCVEDLFFQIEVDSHSERIHNEWADKFPDPSAHYHDVRLKIAGLTVRSIGFYSFDGFRYLVPRPEIVPKDIGASGPNEYYWKRGSLPLKVTDIVGRFYPPMRTLEEFARLTGIKIID